MARWETDFQMEVNVAKCHSVGVIKYLTDTQYRYNYSLLQQTLEVLSAKYLGITITNNIDMGSETN